MKKLSFKEIITVSSMLFGLFFGAGNLIFPVSMGQLAGRNVWQAILGFLITGVGLPLLGVASLALSHSDGLYELSSKVSRPFGFFFTSILYLTIGPFFAIPRCATVSYTVGIEQVLHSSNQRVALALFSLLFFAVVLFFSLRPGELLKWVGKVLNPLFLAFLSLLLLRALLSSSASISEIEPEMAYIEGSFFTGLLEGYNTMDALAALAFGIVVVEAIRELGIKHPDEIAKNTIKAGIFSSILMALIYALTSIVGAESRALFPPSSNGGVALSEIANHYFGSLGAIILAITVTLACLKTAVGLITSASETFKELFPKGPSYKVWAVSFCILSFAIANLGLDKIIAFSLPVLLFLYPLVIVEIALTLFGRFFDDDPRVLRITIAFTSVAALLDFLSALPIEAKMPNFLPLASLGFGWIIPTLIGLLIGLIVRKVKR